MDLELLRTWRPVLPGSLAKDVRVRWYQEEQPSQLLTEKVTSSKITHVAVGRIQFFMSYRAGGLSSMTIVFKSTSVPSHVAFSLGQDATWQLATTEWSKRMSVGQQSGVKQRSLLQCHPNCYISYTARITNEPPGLACFPREPGVTNCKFQEETIQRIYPGRLPAMMHETWIKLKLHLPSQISVQRKNRPVGKS